MTAYELKIMIFPFLDGGQRLVNAIEMLEMKLWKGKGQMLDLNVLTLLLALTDEHSVVRNFTTEARDAIPQEARILKTRISNVVTNTAKLEEVLKQVVVLRKKVQEDFTVMQKQEKEMKKREKEMKKQEKEMKKQEQEMKKQEKEMKKEEELNQLRELLDGLTAQSRHPEKGPPCPKKHKAT